MARSLKKRIESFIEDIADDGKRNYSNEPEKKSPGRPKGVKNKVKKIKSEEKIIVDSPTIISKPVKSGVQKVIMHNGEEYYLIDETNKSYRSKSDKGLTIMY